MILKSFYSLSVKITQLTFRGYSIKFHKQTNKQYRGKRDLCIVIYARSTLTTMLQAFILYCTHGNSIARSEIQKRTGY